MREMPPTDNEHSLAGPVKTVPTDIAEFQELDVQGGAEGVLWSLKIHGIKCLQGLADSTPVFNSLHLHLDFLKIVNSLLPLVRISLFQSFDLYGQRSVCMTRRNIKILRVLQIFVSFLGLI